MSNDGSNGIALGSGASGNLTGAMPSGLTMPNGSGNTLFSMPNGNAANPGAVQMNPMSMGMGTMQGVTPAGSPMGNLPALLGAAAKASASQNPQTGMRSVGGQYRSGGAVNFMPSSAIQLLAQGAGNAPAAGQSNAASLLARIIGSNQNGLV